MSDKFVLSARNSFEQGSKFQKTKEMYLRDSIRYYKFLKFGEAIASSDLALHLDPNFAKAYNIKGLALIELQRYQEAIIAFEDAERIAPDKPDNYIDKALALYMLGRYNDVIVTCTRALQIDSKLVRAYHGRALAQLALRQYQAALVDCSQAIMLDNLVYKVYVTMGNAYFELGLHWEAANAYEHAISQNVRICELRIKKGQILMDEGKKLLQLEDYDSAFLKYDQALFYILDEAKRSSINEMKGIIMAEKGEKLLQLKHFQEASNAFWQAIQCNASIQTVYNSKGEGLFNKGKALLTQRKYEDALELFNAMITFGYKMNEACTTIMTVKFAHASYENVRQAYICINRIFKESCQLTQQEINEVKEQRILVEAFIEAIRHGCKLIDLYQILIKINLYKGNILFSKGLYEKALVAYKLCLSICKDIETILQKQSEHTQYCLLKGKVLIAFGDTHYELKHYQKANLSYKQAFSLFYPLSVAYKQTTLFDTLTRDIELLREKLKKSFQQLKSFHKRELNSMTDEDDEDMEINYTKLMPEEYDDLEKSSSKSFIEEVSDPDNYDENYNQYYVLDIGDELDKYYEAIGLL